MKRDRSAAHQRLAEVLLWAAVGLCGYFVLIPAAAELLRARQLEAEEAEKGETARDLAEEAERDLDWAHNDPLTDRRVQETPGQDLRNYRAERQQGTTQ